MNHLRGGGDDRLDGPLAEAEMRQHSPRRRRGRHRMSRLRGTGDDGLGADEPLTDSQIRRLAAAVPRRGQQRHPPPAGESFGDHHDDPDEWRTTC